MTGESEVAQRGWVAAVLLELVDGLVGVLVRQKKFSCSQLFNLEFRKINFLILDLLSVGTYF